MQHTTKQQARQLLGLPTDQYIIMTDLQFQPDNIAAFMPVLFSLSALHRLHTSRYSLYVLSKNKVDMLTATCIAQQSQALGISDHLFFNLNPPDKDYELASMAVDFSIHQNTSCTCWKTTSKGRGLLENLYTLPVKEEEKTLLSKSLIKKLLTIHQPGRAASIHTSFQQEPVVFFYTLFWLIKKELIEQCNSRFYTSSSLTTYSKTIISCYEQGKMLVAAKGPAQPPATLHYPDKLRIPFIQPFIHYLNQKLGYHLQKLTDAPEREKILHYLLSIFINEMDARFLQAIAIWQRDHNKHMLAQQKIIHQLQKKGGLCYLLKIYPGWAYLTWSYIFMSFRQVTRLLQRLEKDIPTIEAHFFNMTSPVKLHSLSYLSDTRFQGPVKLTFTNQNTLVYKPRDLRSEMAVTGCTARSLPTPCRSLAEHFNEWNNRDIIHTLAFFCRKDTHGYYGYVEYVLSSPAPGKKEQAFLLGKVSTFALISGMADLHSDNICHYQGKLAILDCKYLFSPVILQRLVDELSQLPHLWNDTSLAATHMNSLWEHQPGYILSTNTAYIKNNNTVAFRKKNECLVTKPPFKLFRLTNAILPDIKDAFNNSWKNICLNKHRLQQWLNNNSCITVCQLPLTPSKSALHQHALANCDVFYCHTPKQLADDTSRRIDELIKLSPVADSFDSTMLAKQWLRQKTINNYYSPDIKKWKKLLVSRCGTTAHSQLAKHYISMLKTTKT